MAAKICQDDDDDDDEYQESAKPTAKWKVDGGQSKSHTLKMHHCTEPHSQHEYQTERQLWSLQQITETYI